MAVFFFFKLTLLSTSLSRLLRPKHQGKDFDKQRLLSKFLLFFPSVSTQSQSLKSEIFYLENFQACFKFYSRRLIWREFKSSTYNVIEPMWYLPFVCFFFKCKICFSHVFRTFINWEKYDAMKEKTIRHR